MAWGQEKGADFHISALRACQYEIFDFVPCSLPLKTLILLTFSCFLIRRRGMAVPFVFAAPCRGGRPCPPDLRPILFFLFWRKKRTAAPGEEKKENFRNRKFSPCRHHVTAQSPSLICPPQITPNCDPAQRSQFGKEEGASGYGAFAASAEAECSWLLLTPRRTLS